MPGKHMRILGAKPVIQHTIDAVLASKYGACYGLSSDDNEILDCAAASGILAIQRPPELALDTTPTLPALVHAVELCEWMHDTRFEYIAEIRATSPFKTTQDIEAAIDLLIKSGADSVIGVTKLDDHHPARIKWLDDHGYIHDFMPEPESGRRQDCWPRAYIRNGTIYALRRDSLGKLFGHDKSIGYVMPPERSINIDTEMDWRLCQLLIGQQK